MTSVMLPGSGPSHGHCHAETNSVELARRVHVAATRGIHEAEEVRTNHRHDTHATTVNRRVIPLTDIAPHVIRAVRPRRIRKCPNWSQEIRGSV